MKYEQENWFAAIGAMLAFAITSVMLWKGITLTPDGWAYWEGSVSMMHGKGFEYFGGQDITVFPPLFSIILSLLQSITGISGFSLFLYLAILSGLNAFIWIYLFLRINKGGLTISNMLFVVYIVCFTGSYFTVLLAETMSLPLFGISILLLVKLIEEPGEILSGQRQLSIVAVLTALLLTKNSNISFLPPYFLVIAFTVVEQRFRRVITAAILAASPIIFWLLIRYYLGQTGSHPIVFSGNYSFTEYIYQFGQGLSHLFGPNIIGLSLLVASAVVIVSNAIERKRNNNAYTMVYVSLFVIVGSIFLLFILFNFVWIHDKFQGRFIWALPITITGSMLVLLNKDTNVVRRNVILVLLAAVTLVQAGRTGMHIWYRLQDNYQASLQPHHTINPNYIVGPPVRQESYILLSPPEYSWITR